MIKKYLVLLIAFFYIPFVQAQTDIKLVDAQDVIENLKTSLESLAAKTNLPVIFPEQLPAPSHSDHYYLYTETKPDSDRYLISIDSTPDCHGAHYCSLGSLTAVRGESPQIYSSIDRQELTVPVQLAIKKIGYFTPGHAMGSFWPSQLEWRERSVLYRMSWNLPKESEKPTLIAVVNTTAKGTHIKGNHL